MKSLSEVVQNVVNVPATQSTSVALMPRLNPLSGEEIEKMQAAVDKHFIVKHEETYGYVPVNVNGDAVRQEYDVTGEVVTYIPRDKKPPQNLWEAMLRPARRDHIIYHLGRLGAHRRDTRGDAAFQVVMEDIANDINGTAEWAVVMACAEMRRKNSNWYPNTGEILSIIKKYETMMNELYARRLGSPQLTHNVPPKRDMNNYYKDARDNPIRRELCDFLISKGKDDYFNLPGYSNYQLEMMAGSNGWKKEPTEASVPDHI